MVKVRCASGSLPAARPNAERVYWSPNLREIHDDLIEALRLGNGITVVTGECGVGKTTLIRLFLRQVPSSYVVIQLNSCNFGQVGVVSWILQALEVPNPESGDGLKELETALAELAERGVPAVVAIDEAQGISPQDFAELAAAIECMARHSARVFLFGQPELATRLSRRVGRAISARTRRKHILRPLNRQDMAGFVESYIAGWSNGRLHLTEQAVEALHRATKGSPRLVCRLCDAVMNLSEKNGLGEIDHKIIADALAHSNTFGIFSDVSSTLRTHAASPRSRAECIARAIRSSGGRGGMPARVDAEPAPPDEQAPETSERSESVRPVHRPPVLDDSEEISCEALFSSAELVVYETLDGRSYEQRRSAQRGETSPTWQKLRAKSDARFEDQRGSEAEEPGVIKTGAETSVVPAMQPTMGRASPAQRRDVNYLRSRISWILGVSLVAFAIGVAVDQLGPDGMGEWDRGFSLDPSSLFVSQNTDLPNGASEPAVTTATQEDDPVAAAERHGAAGSAELRLFHSSADGDAVRRVSGTLRQHGYRSLRLEKTDWTVLNTNVRYYHRADETLARQIAEILTSTGRAGGVIVRDFTSYRPKPGLHSIEIWYRGNNVGGN